jgi:hypothetical protein
MGMMRRRQEDVWSQRPTSTYELLHSAGQDSERPKRRFNSSAIDIAQSFGPPSIARSPRTASQGDLARLSFLVLTLVQRIALTFAFLKFGLRNRGSVFVTVACTVSLVMMLWLRALKMQE